MRFVLERVALGQGFLLAVQFYPITIVPPLLHAHSFTTDSVQSQPMAASLSNSIKQDSVPEYTVRPVVLSDR